MTDFPTPLPLDPMPPALPDGFVCPEGTVPGWLNDDGLPTSCVGDLPIPLPVFESPIAPYPEGELIPPVTVYPPDVLAATGVEWFLIAAVACALVAVGLAFLAAASRSPRPRYKRK